MSLYCKVYIKMLYWSSTAGGRRRVAVATTIRQLRLERGWTQLELAHRLQVTPVTVYNWERGRTEPRLAQFRQLARLFAVRMDAIAPPANGTPEGE